MINLEEGQSRLANRRKAKKVFDLGEYDCDYEGVRVNVFAPTAGSMEGIKVFGESNRRSIENRENASMDKETVKEYITAEYDLIKSCITISDESGTFTPENIDIAMIPQDALNDILKCIFELGDIPLPDSPNGQRPTRNTGRHERQRRG